MNGSLSEPSISERVALCVATAKQQVGRREDPLVVVAPYRFNPLGAHIDHQGGSVLARTLNQYTVLCFWPTETEECVIHAKLNDRDGWQTTTFQSPYQDPVFHWDAMPRAAFSALADVTDSLMGIHAVVFGTLVSGGLSSSASVILAYLTAMAHSNDIQLTKTELVELVRKVENDYRGLNNGLQDQMSIVFGQSHCMTLLNVEHCSAEQIADPPSVKDVRFLMCYSGVSRDLAGSGFNTRVAECREAAKHLYTSATHLGDVPKALRSEKVLATLPALLNRRATHVYGEMERVNLGVEAWRMGAWEEFGELMNTSCMSSINNYESGSDWLIALHEIAKGISGVYGNRFSGGGYGGCLFMLVSADKIQAVADEVLSVYLSRYPDLVGRAKIVTVESEQGVRLFNE